MGRIFFLILAFFSTSGFAADNYKTKNVRYKYDISAPVFLDYKIAALDGKATIFLEVSILAETDVLENYRINYEIYPNLNSTTLLKSDSLSYTENLIARDQNVYYLKFEMAISEPSVQVIVNIADTNSDNIFSYAIPIDLKSEIGKTDLLLMEAERDIPIFRNYVSDSDSFRIISYYESTDQVFVYQYKHEFVPAAPPMAEKKGVEKRLEIDSLFSVSVNEKINLTENGLYFVQKDTSTLKGIGFRVQGIYYPKYAKIEDLIDPLRYISTTSEYNTLKKSKDIKKALDRYWLNTAKFPDRAKDIIRNYYQQVEKANIMFTNYKEGWKTDRGMVYIIFGLPSSVNESEEFEEWTYNNETLKIKFTFDKLGNLFTDKHYNLVRKENYDKVWFRMVDSWRKGRSEI